MRSSIPNYAVTIQPLHTLLKEIFKLAGKMMKRSIGKVKINKQWGGEEEKGFKNIKAKDFTLHHAGPSLAEGTTLLVDRRLEFPLGGHFHSSPSGGSHGTCAKLTA